MSRRHKKSGSTFEHIRDNPRGVNKNHTSSSGLISFNAMTFNNGEEGDFEELVPGNTTMALG